MAALVLKPLLEKWGNLCKIVLKLCDDWKIDYESYSWKKLDAKAPETKQLVHDYFAWEGDFGGKKFNQGKIFGCQSNQVSFVYFLGSKWLDFFSSPVRCCPIWMG